MPLVKNGAITADPWTRIADDAEIPASGPVILSLARRRAEAAALAGRQDPIGLALPNDQAVNALTAEDLAGVALVALAFPKFRDGRGFTQARLLRERFGFKGELRAVGDVIPDQVQFLERVGVDAIEVATEAQAEALIAVRRFYAAYPQPALDGAPTLTDLRRRLSAGAGA